MKPQPKIWYCAFRIGLAGLIWLTPASGWGDTGPNSAAVRLRSEKQLTIGLGAGIHSDPEESAYRSAMVPVSLFLDWEFGGFDAVTIRAGYTATRSRLDFTAYRTDWRYQLTTQSTYLGYRLRAIGRDHTEAFLLLGLAHVQSDLQTNRRETPQRLDAVVCRDDGFGLIGGAGVDLPAGPLRIGLQLEVLSRTASFDGIDTAVGHQLLALTVRCRL